eukprot:4984528-Amphidinium_carterae.1
MVLHSVAIAWHRGHQLWREEGRIGRIGIFYGFVAADLVTWGHHRCCICDSKSKLFWNSNDNGSDGSMRVGCAQVKGYHYSFAMQLLWACNMRGDFMSHGWVSIRLALDKRSL